MKRQSYRKIGGGRLTVISRLACDDHGFTILELLIAALITTVVASAGFSFYAKMNQVSLAQVDVSETQQLARSTIGEISRTLRSAGFRLPKGQPAFKLKGDSLSVYGRGAQPIDTTLYFLQEFTALEYARVPGLPDSQKVWKLMKQTNSSAPAIFSDYITSLNYDPVDSATLAVTVTILASRKDHSYVPNAGFRRYSLGCIVEMQNLR